MAVKSKTGVAASRHEIKRSGPKKSRQGNGQHSRPRGTRKLRRGQGR
jgi:hypothetical protein